MSHSYFDVGRYAPGISLSVISIMFSVLLQKSFPVTDKPSTGRPSLTSESHTGFIREGRDSGREGGLKFVKNRVEEGGVNKNTKETE